MLIYFKLLNNCVEIRLFNSQNAVTKILFTTLL